MLYAIHPNWVVLNAHRPGFGDGLAQWLADAAKGGGGAAVSQADCALQVCPRRGCREGKDCKHSQSVLYIKEACSCYSANALQLT